MRLARLEVSLAVGVMVAGCGGIVVVDGDGSGGGGGSGTGGPSASSQSTDADPSSGISGSSSGNSTGSSGVGGGDPCASFCSSPIGEACSTLDSGCSAECETALDEAGPCAANLGDLLGCMVANGEGIYECTIPDACESAFDEYESCFLKFQCGDPSCFVSSDGTCGCKTSCQGLTYNVECKAGACQCLINGTTVGACAESAAGCDMFNGCCADVFW